jgi:hypothetical protein
VDSLIYEFIYREYDKWPASASLQLEFSYEWAYFGDSTCTLRSIVGYVRDDFPVWKYWARTAKTKLYRHLLALQNEMNLVQFRFLLFGGHRRMLPVDQRFLKGEGIVFEAGGRLFLALLA